MTDDKHPDPRADRGEEIVRLVASALRAHGVDPSSVLTRAGLAPNARTATTAETYRLIELAAEATRDPVFGLHLVESVEPRAWGLYFYLIGTASSVREALSVSVGHIGLTNPGVTPNLTFEADGSATLENRYVDIRRPGLKHAVEFAFAFMSRLFQRFAGPGFRHGAAAFNHQRTDEIEAFERFFGCPVTFGAPADRITFPKETLDLPFLSADDAVHATLERLAARQERAARAPQDASQRARVEAELRRQFAHGYGGMDAVAVALGMSGRSLTRRLASEHTTFSEVLDDLRRRLAVEYLAKPDLTLGQIAYLVGYDDPGAFSAAFRRWTGRAPSEARADAAGLGRIGDRGEPAALETP